jgi:hypothetical protein
MKALGIRLLAALTIGCTTNVIAADSENILNPTRPYKTEFVVSHHIGKSTVYVSARFLDPNSRELPAGDTLTVNGIPFVGNPHMKPGWLGAFRIGYAYSVDIPLAERYEIVLRHAVAGLESRFEIFPRRFVPNIPTRISRNSDLRIPFNGPPAMPGEKLSPHIKLAEGRESKEYQKRGFRLIGEMTGNEIVLSAAHAKNPIIEAGLTDIPPGPAVLDIGLFNQDFIDNRHELTYVVTQYAPVVIEE